VLRSVVTWMLLVNPTRSAENRQLKIAEMQNQLKVAGISASRASEFERQYEAFKADPKQFEQFKKSLTSQDDTTRLNAYVKADEYIAKAFPNLIFSNKPEDKAKLETERAKKVTEYLGAINKGSSATPAAPAVPQPGPDGTINIPGKGTFKQLPNGNFVKV
jgi:ribosome-binding ATPase YchF (GTP1/OBG family)